MSHARLFDQHGNEVIEFEFFKQTQCCLSMSGLLVNKACLSRGHLQAGDRSIIVIQYSPQPAYVAIISRKDESWLAIWTKDWGSLEQKTLDFAARYVRYIKGDSRWSQEVAKELSCGLT